MELKKNKIKAKKIEIIEGNKSVVKSNNQEKSLGWKIWIIIAGAIAVLAGIAEMSGYSIRDLINMK